jgi:hypothetical protein
MAMEQILADAEKKMCEVTCGKCGKLHTNEGGTCPYSEEILDKIEVCNCCDDCMQECLYDI